MDDSPVIDGAAKAKVKAALVAAAEADLRRLREAAATEAAAVGVDPDAAISVDDLSQSDSYGQDTGLIRGDAQDQAELLGQIQALDFGPKQTVGPGAIIGYGGDRYVVGVPIVGVDCDGVSYDGISLESPIYPAIEGLRGGDTFTFNGHEFRIDLVA